MRTVIALALLLAATAATANDPPAAPESSRPTGSPERVERMAESARQRFARCCDGSAFRRAERDSIRRAQAQRVGDRHPSTGRSRSTRR